MLQYNYRNHVEKQLDLNHSHLLGLACDVLLQYLPKDTGHYVFSNSLMASGNLGIHTAVHCNCN
jgi:hypothetical protein